MKRIQTRVDLPAIPSVVWEQLTDTASSRSWDPFITSASGILAVGQRLRVRIAPHSGRHEDVLMRIARRIARRGQAAAALHRCVSLNTGREAVRPAPGHNPEPQVTSS
ncbi:hypothetical protein GCM10009740_20640 [Terrabacter terrae]|uniref:SRPBCC domain-containing protein n=1 Tax=Terrabacter terrae TaxID=318434 RepID=A0ABN2UE51_9MICO